SGATLVHFAANWRNYPGCDGLRAFVADVFEPSLARLYFYLSRYISALRPEWAAANRCVWAHFFWSLAEYQGWPLETFFAERAISFLGVKEPTAAGPLPRLRAVRLTPVRKSALAPPLVAVVAQDLGRMPTGDDVRSWLHSPPFDEWL